LSLKRGLKSLAVTSLGWRATSFVRPSGVIVLTYHRIGRPGDRFPGHPLDAFRDQMQWIVARCRPIAPERLQEVAVGPRVDRPPVLVTFDDGYLSYRQRAYPVLKELGIPALVFLATAYIDEPTRLFWWDALRAGVMGTTKDHAELPWSTETVMPLHDRAARERLLKAAKQHLKSIPDDRHESEVAELLDRLGTSADALRGEPEMMSWEDAKATADITRFGGHTHTHPILSMVPDDRIEVEIATCHNRILSATGERPRFFAYPNGRGRDFDERSRAALRRHGFDVAFSTEEGVNGPDTDWMAVRRFAGDGSLPDLAWRLLAWPRR
jgi:peptidoglycan/xylan/chitin deacetylase (PgdA/CDA1 family)